ncbi:MAG: hypothetical protein V1782_07770 [Pseudomonadota bacterium]
MKTKNCLLVGNGGAGTNAPEAVRLQDTKGGITILSEEDTPFYCRIRLNEFIAGDVDVGEMEE